MKQWNQGPVLVGPIWFAAGDPRFSLFHYDMLTEEAFREKVAQLPRGMHLRWQILNVQVSIAEQEALYERFRALGAEHGVVIEKFTPQESGK